MMSFTGSTRAGIAVAKAAAPTRSSASPRSWAARVANIILDDADLAKAVAGGRDGLHEQLGPVLQCADAHVRAASRTRIEAAAIAKAAAKKIKVGDPFAERPRRSAQWSAKFSSTNPGLIKKGIDEGATLVTGGLGRPEGLNRGYYVRPTVFANVANDMTIAREEIFGPVLSIFGLRQRRRRHPHSQRHGLWPVRLCAIRQYRTCPRRWLAASRTGNVHLNGAGPDFNAPFGGYKQSGNGREWGELGFDEFLETKAVMGYQA